MVSKKYTPCFGRSQENRNSWFECHIPTNFTVHVPPHVVQFHVRNNLLINKLKLVIMNIYLLPIVLLGIGPTKSINVWSNAILPRLDICIGTFVFVMTLVFSQIEHFLT